ncbi:hypothetical protein SLNWT_4839 [Streptomyces albus]|uniref:Uncharacterized protein n=1 Tax=Streptomyces albus (strain ATCC 21838 / DSM 41398 / FERM P-419 / JCM 4703 / NBRC 107858) TaxID=1081613 RepID=A0A0B5F0V7_STRA4|nr:hypothetical protein SLNWT_4839 [Streptomyces albus]AOU79522.1 hypothetical protein SLNHY_4831 [Streptomyces albus]AYN35245.1 hypothetical protein DUI70_4747 [Streptomyces albus]
MSSAFRPGRRGCADPFLCGVGAILPQRQAARAACGQLPRAGNPAWSAPCRGELGTGGLPGSGPWAPCSGGPVRSGRAPW